MTAAALALSATDVPVEKIAQRMQVSPREVRRIIKQARDRSRLRHIRSVPDYLAIYLPERFQFLEAAEARNISISELVRRMAIAAMKDGFVDAILDDGIITPGEAEI
ncbi:MAG: hypothetical protein COW16_10540 [Sphingomonadales bacterium CG12_big_fil_rev_8_21_14_0_65_65_10]|nr:MAG: hypothetical protein COW16_10540 [Sphingomonadales bacterium CG12_big_fil_rev_8_21_14_0_65_65_10]